MMKYCDIREYEKRLEIMRAFQNGSPIEFYIKFRKENWRFCENPAWNFDDCEYRIANDIPTATVDFIRYKVKCPVCGHLNFIDSNTMYGGKNHEIECNKCEEGFTFLIEE